MHISSGAWCWIRNIGKMTAVQTCILQELLNSLQLGYYSTHLVLLNNQLNCHNCHQLLFGLLSVEQ